MDMALSKYQYTKGKHWYFKNAGKKEMGLSVCLEFSDISSHMMPAKIHGHQCPHILKQAPETMQKVIEWI